MQTVNSGQSCNHFCAQKDFGGKQTKKKIKCDRNKNTPYQRCAGLGISQESAEQVRRGHEGEQKKKSGLLFLSECKVVKRSILLPTLS